MPTSPRRRRPAASDAFLDRFAQSPAAYMRWREVRLMVNALEVEHLGDLLALGWIEEVKRLHGNRFGLRYEDGDVVRSFEHAFSEAVNEGMTLRARS